MDALLLGLIAGALFGAMTVAVRWALVRGGDPIVGSLVTASVAFLVAGALALATEISFDGVELLPFLAVGVFVPGVSQVAFISAIRHAGPSRAAILVGTAPLLSVLLALALLDEPLRLALLAGTVLIVAGGAALALDPGRPVGFRRLGVALALLCALLFAARDNAVRWFARDLDPPALHAATASLLGAAIGAAVYVALVRRRSTIDVLRPTITAFVPAGILLGGAYCALVAGFERGNVAVVAPFNATQSLWAVLLAAVAYRRVEVIGRRTVLAAVLVVAGGALIAASR